MNKNALWTPDLVMPGPLAHTPKQGMELANLRQLGIIPGVAGGAPRQGTHVAADVVTQTADGTDLNQIWNQFVELLNAVNAQRQALINFLIFPVTQPVETVTQPGQGVDFEEASEFGEPVGQRIAPSYFQMGYTFKWYDLASRYTWQYLADATDAMVNSVANSSVEAYVRLLMFNVLKTAFNNTNLTTSIRGNAYNVYKFYNADGTVPPTYKNNTFQGNHTHYKGTGTSPVGLEAQDLDVLILDDFTSHGYSTENGYQVVIMVNTALGNVVRNFRNAVNSNQAVGGNYGRFDFVPAQGQPGQLINVNQQLIGQERPANTLRGLTVIGSYGPALIVQEDYMPDGYVFSFATGGPENFGNPIGLRQHANSALRGLRLVKGRNADYPLIDSFWAAGFGTGVRQRGAGIVLQVGSATYTPPAIYA